MDEMSRSYNMVTSTFYRAGFNFPLIPNTAATTASMASGHIVLPFFSTNHSPCIMQRAFLPGLDYPSTQLFLTSISTLIKRTILSSHLSYVINHDGGLKRWPLY